jgi:hypothetical protein
MPDHASPQSIGSSSENNRTGDPAEEASRFNVGIGLASATAKPALPFPSKQSAATADALHPLVAVALVRSVMSLRSKQSPASWTVGPMATTRRGRPVACS